MLCKRGGFFAGKTNTFHAYSTSCCGNESLSWDNIACCHGRVNITSHGCIATLKGVCDGVPQDWNRVIPVIGVERVIVWKGNTISSPFTKRDSLYIVTKVLLTLLTANWDYQELMSAAPFISSWDYIHCIYISQVSIICMNAEINTATSI